MTHAHTRYGEGHHSLASLQAALEELAALPVDVSTSRTIAMAVGILIERYKIAPEEGFDLVVAVSQHAQRRAGDVASDLTTGRELEAPQSALASGVALAG